MRFLFFLLAIAFVSCTAKTAKTTSAQNTPEQNFEVFWKTFQDNYAFFEEKQVNWQQTYQQFRPRVTAKTTDSELVQVFGQMLEPLSDGHINIFHQDKRVFKGESRSNQFQTEFKGLETDFWQNTHRLLQQNGFSEPKPLGVLLKEKPFLYSARSKQLGYLHITRFFNNLNGITGSDDDEARDQKELLQLIDEQLHSFQDCTGLVIDLRDNGGGHSGFEAAGRFTAETKLTHLLSTRISGHFTYPEEFFVKPASEKPFLKPVVVLISDRTASAAEDFALALSKMPNANLIGTRTKGMFSSMYGFTLPNGMEITLSNQRYLTPELQLLEDRGVLPNLEIANTREALQNQTDPVLQKALEMLAK